MMVHHEREPEPIDVPDISALPLAEFLSRQDSHLQFKETPGKPITYSEIFSHLRSLSFNNQLRLLTKFYTEGVRGFPQGQKVAALLTKCNNIPWAQPREEPKPSQLQTFVTEAYSRLKLPPQQVKIITSWPEAEKITQETKWAEEEVTARRVTWAATIGKRHKVQVAAEEAASGATWTTALKAGKEKTTAIVALATTRWAIQVAIWAAAWVVVEDLIAQTGYEKSPWDFEALIGISNLGCLPLGRITNTKKREEFAIFVPPSLKST